MTCCTCLTCCSVCDSLEWSTEMDSDREKNIAIQLFRLRQLFLVKVFCSQVDDAREAVSPGNVISVPALPVSRPSSYPQYNSNDSNKKDTEVLVETTNNSDSVDFKSKLESRLIAHAFSPVTMHNVKPLCLHIKRFYYPKFLPLSSLPDRQHRHQPSAVTSTRRN